MSKKTVTTHDGKELLAENAVEVNGKYYSKKKTSPPEVIYTDEGWVLYSDKYVKTERHGWVLKINTTVLLLPEKLEYFANYDYAYDAINRYIKENNLISTPLRSEYIANAKENHSLKLFGTKYSCALYGHLYEKYGLELDILTGKYTKLTASRNATIQRTIDTGYIEPKKKFGKGIVALPRNKKLAIKYGVESPSYIIPEKLKYSFGVELETCSGVIHPHEYTSNQLNVSCAHDGSIQGGEYVTGVLRGDSGFKQLYDICNLLSGRCKLDKTCGIHVHIGGVVFNKSFSVLSYLLGRKVEEDIFKLMPPSRRNNEFCGDLSDLNIQKIFDEYGYEYGVAIAYDELYRMMSIGHELGKNSNKTRPHRFGRWTGRYNGVEHENNFRYKWLNLIPCNFNVRGYNPSMSEKDKVNLNTPYTLEFRNHSASLNYNKIKNWVLICMAFVNYIEHHPLEIINKKKITVEDLIISAYSKNAGPLLKYVATRKAKFSKGASEGDELADMQENIKYEQKIKIKDFLCV